MKKAVVILATIAALMVAPVVALAQGPGEGGPIIEGNGGTSIGAVQWHGLPRGHAVADRWDARC